MDCTMYTTIKRPGIAKKDIAYVVSFVGKKLQVTGEVSVHLIGDARMKTLNFLYRRKDSPTDVLSFAAQEETFPIPGDYKDWGDIFLDVDYIRRQATRCGVSYKEEMLRMLIHGILHILGYDHMTKKDAAIMFPLQENFLKEVL